MAKTPLRQQILNLALPVAIQSVLVSLLGMSDVFMVAGLGPAAIAAIGLGAKLHFVLIMVMAGLGSAISILVAQYHGRNETRATQAVLTLGNLAGLFLLVPMSVAFFVFPRTLLTFLSNDPAMIELGVEYLRLTVPLLLLTHIIICFESALRARNETVLPMALSAVAIVLNIALNYGLIHGIGLFPQLGVAGVAIASDIARFAQVVLLLAVLGHRGHVFSVDRLINAWFDIPRYFKRFFITAWPLAVNFSVWGIGTFVYHGIASKVGTEALAALSLISPIEGLYHSLFFGLVTACSVLVGQSLGRDDFVQAKWLAKKFAQYAPLGSLLVGLVILVCIPVFLPWLLDETTSLYHLSATLLAIMCLTFWVKVLNMTLIVGILRAGGDSKFVLGADMIAMWLLGLPAVWLAAFVFELSYPWVYALVLVEEAVKCGLTLYRARQGIWLRNLTREDDQAGPTETELAA